DVAEQRALVLQEQADEQGRVRPGHRIGLPESLLVIGAGTTPYTICDSPAHSPGILSGGEFPRPPQIVGRVVAPAVHPKGVPCDAAFRPFCVWGPSWRAPAEVLPRRPTSGPTRPRPSSSRSTSAPSWPATASSATARTSSAAGCAW